MKVSSRGSSASYSSFLLDGLSRAWSAWLKRKCHYSRLTQMRNTILGHEEEESSRAVRGIAKEKRRQKVCKKSDIY